MKNIVLLIAVVILSGCATHAQINMSAVTEVNSPVFESKSFSSDIYYSQPEPGIFTGGERQELKPLSQQNLSIASASVLRKLPSLIEQQLPKSSTLVDDAASDFVLKIELVANDKKGPTYADYEFLKSFGKNLFTLGLASSEYDIIADFDVKYVLIKSGQEVFSKDYRVNESVDHERGDFESYNSVHQYSSQLLEKHLVLTLNDFFKVASTKI